MRVLATRHRWIGRTWPTRTAVRLGLATVVVSVVQAIWYVETILSRVSRAEPPGWEVSAIANVVFYNLVMGIGPFVVAFLLANVRRRSRIVQILAVVVPTAVGAYCAVWLLSLGYGDPEVAEASAWIYLALGVAAYGTALLVRPPLWRRNDREAKHKRPAE